jgi:hypothetical protein
MRRDKIAKLADALGTTIDDILGLESPPQTVSQEEDDFPEVRMIARAGKKMSPERKADMIRMLKMMFPEEFGESL